MASITSIPRIIASVALIYMSSVGAFGNEAAHRTKSGLTLEVPEAQKKRGQVYYVIYPSWDTQITFSSEAPLERIIGRTSNVVGFAVAAMDESTPNGNIKYGAFRVPVKSLDTGIPARNGHLQTTWFDAAEHPDISFVLDSARNAELVKSDVEFTTYGVTVMGHLSMNGHTKRVKTPARITFMKPRRETRQRADGDLMAIRCKFTVNRKDFGVDWEPMSSLRVAETIDVDVYLIFSTEPPETQGRSQGGS